MIRRIIHIDEEKCNGCGACANACHEGAIGMVNGKAKLLRDDYCDGLGDCLPNCPMGAISFVEREAAEYDEEAVRKHMESRAALEKLSRLGCPGERARSIKPLGGRSEKPAGAEQESELMQWPCQIKLMPVSAPYYDGAELLIAADCTAFAYAGLHSRFMRGRITVNGCPKLDNTDYSEKLCEILKNNNIKSVSLVRMQVPCCGGLLMAAKKAIEKSGKKLPLDVTVISTDGKIL